MILSLAIKLSCGLHIPIFNETQLPNIISSTVDQAKEILLVLAWIAKELQGTCHRVFCFQPADDV